MGVEAVVQYIVALTHLHAALGAAHVVRGLVVRFQSACLPPAGESCLYYSGFRAFTELWHAWYPRPCRESGRRCYKNSFSELPRGRRCGGGCGGGVTGVLAHQVCEEICIRENTRRS